MQIANRFESGHSLAVDLMRGVRRDDLHAVYQTLASVRVRRSKCM